MHRPSPEPLVSVLDLKRSVVAAVREVLKDRLLEARARAEDARVAATHEENKPENDKDMRSTEASYVARGQAERVAALERAMAMMAAMEIGTFTDGDPIALSALVDVRSARGVTRYFLVQDGGGIAVCVQNASISTLATTSPLGRALLGLEVGDEVTAGPAGQTYEIDAVA